MEVLEVELPESQTFAAGLSNPAYVLAFAWWPVLVRIAQEIDQELVLAAVPAMISWVEARKWPLFIKSQLLRVLNDLLLNPDIFGEAQANT